MSCDRFAQVHAYHDDALAASDRVAVENHLEGCADCRALLSDLRGLSNLFAAAPLAMLSPAAMARLSRSLVVARDQGILRITSWLTAAAAAVLIGALLLWPDRTATVAGNGGTTAIATATNGPALETVAIMPPESEDAVPEVITLAQWMANDLSYGVGGGGTSVGGGVGGDRQ